MYLIKVGFDGREGTLQPVLLLKCDESCRIANL
jgi:hypothetical protein